jgi:alpha-beta hydrolase superfamily lysophospholipase
MFESKIDEFKGSRGNIALHVWPCHNPRAIALIAHGYGEHAGRYAHVAERLVMNGAAVYAPDHLGHGRSEGARALIDRFDDMVDDLRVVADRARADHPGLPMVLIGHSMGGLMAARYAQLHGEELVGLVLSGPAIGGNLALEGLLDLEPIPEIPIDPASLSRDPKVGRDYTADPLVWNGPFQRQTLEALIAGIADVAAGQRLTTLPLLWIHGDEDSLAPIDAARPAIERLRGESFESIIYEGARHEVFNETNRDEVLDALISFVNRVQPTG